MERQPVSSPGCSPERYDLSRCTEVHCNMTVYVMCVHIVHLIIVVILLHSSLLVCVHSVIYPVIK